jgi:hypothetical protein
VRVGPIDPAALESAVHAAPPDLRDRTEYLIDLLWQAGCLANEVPRPTQGRGPDVVCILPGRTPHRIVVISHLAGELDDDGKPKYWSGTAILPFLYRALGVEPREHSFEFVAFGKSPQLRFRDYLKELEAARHEDVRAIVEIQDVGPAAIAFASSDPGLRQDFVATGQAIGRPPGSVRTFTYRQLGRRPAIPAIAIAVPPSDGRKQLPPVQSGAVGDTEGFRSSARLVAVYLGYLDETLRLRAGGPSAEVGAR